MFGIPSGAEFKRSSERNGGDDDTDILVRVFQLVERSLHEGRRGGRGTAVAGERGITGLSHLAARRHRSLYSAEHRRRIVLLHSLPRAQNEAGD